MNKMLWGLSVALFLCVGKSIAQQVDFIYNETGGRIVRTVLIFPSDPKTRSVDTLNHNTLAIDKLGSREIRVYPNPVKEVLVVEISSGSTMLSEKELLFKLYDASGNLRWEKLSSDFRVSIDFSPFSTGWYIFRIMDGEESREYKIIRQ